MTKVKMGDVWDRTTQVLSGRAGALASIAVVTLFLPLVAMLLVALILPPTAPSTAIVTLFLLLVVAAIGVLGVLAMLALASDPATTRGDAWRLARQRVGPAIGVSAVLILVAVVASLPAVFVLWQAKLGMAALAGAGAARVPSGTATFLAVYYAAYLVLALWALARLAPLNAVVLHERLGLGAIRRSFALTRGHGWRLLGVVLLYLIVLAIVRTAVQSVVGVVFRLLLGAERIPLALMLAGVTGAMVTTAFTVIAVTFTAQLYVALAARQPTRI
ncbi:hypothetical protein [uncultured Sphingomonas sp.]|uniref:hypothetical protein n=1 Tax=uncultured Sphingomonas sp. TaxID=158754 RepID=UPI0035C994C5